MADLFSFQNSNIHNWGSRRAATPGRKSHTSRADRIDAMTRRKLANTAIELETGRPTGGRMDTRGVDAYRADNARRGTRAQRLQFQKERGDYRNERRKIEAALESEKIKQSGENRRASVLNRTNREKFRSENITKKDIADQVAMTSRFAANTEAATKRAELGKTFSDQEKWDLSEAKLRKQEEAAKALELKNKEALALSERRKTPTDAYEIEDAMKSGDNKFLNALSNPKLNSIIKSPRHGRENMNLINDTIAMVESGKITQEAGAKVIDGIINNPRDAVGVSDFLLDAVTLGLAGTTGRDSSLKEFRQKYAASKPNYDYDFSK